MLGHLPVESGLKERKNIIEHRRYNKRLLVGDVIFVKLAPILF